MLGATWLEIRPGRVASVWPPGLAEGTDESVANRLLNHAVSQSLEAGALIVQSLVADQNCRDAQWLCASGFQHTTDVLCMDCDSNKFPRQSPLSELEFEPYSEADLSRWNAVVLASYEKSQDCPKMQTVRPIADVLASYRAVGRFSPNHWFLARYGGRDVGCVLVTQHLNQDWELAYLGVVPEARGRGFGLKLVRRAQWLAAEGGGTHLSLAVDANNAPAIAVYRAAGFTFLEPHSVYSYIAKTLEGAFPAT
jgi:ribosomal protein S18 acetylase RimI-like enzyme